MTESGAVQSAPSEGGNTITSTEFRSDRTRSHVNRIVSVVLWTLFVLVLTLVFIYPIFMVVFGAVHGNDLPRWASALDFNGIVSAYASGTTWKTLGNSVILAVVSGAIATVLGALFAWLNTSTNVPLRRLLTPVMILIVFLPPLFFTFGWELLANSRNGLFNELLQNMGGPSGVFNIESWTGLIFTLSIGFVPFPYILLLGAFANRDQALDEAAQISGSGIFRTFFTVTIPSVGPAIIGAAMLLLVLIFQAFDSPVILGRNPGIIVFSTAIYNDIQGTDPAAYNTAFSLALMLVVLVVLLFVAQRKILGQRTFTTLSGKSARHDRQRLGGVRWLFMVLIILFSLCALALPLGAVIVGSLEPIFGVLGQFTLSNYQQVLTDPTLVQSLTLTAQLAVIGGFVSMGVSVLTTYVMMRRRGFLRGFTSFAMWIPWALPGVVTALAYLWTILTIPGANQLYATKTLLIVVLIVATIPLCVRLAEGALAQLSPELEEAGRVSGARAPWVFLSIVMRLLIPSFLAGWFLSALFITGNLSVSILLAPPGVTPVSVAAFQLYINGDASTGAALFIVIMLAAAIVLGVAAGVWGVLRRIRRQREIGAPSTSVAKRSAASVS